METQQYLSFTVPAAVSGINARDPIDSMQPSEALQLCNLIPDGRNLKLRKGYTEHSTASSSAVRGLFTYTTGAGVSKLVATANNKIYDVSTSSSSDITGSTTPTSNDWQAVQFRTRLILVNGADQPQQYDGSTVSDAAYTGITDDSTLVHVTSFKSRLYFVEKDSTSVWYGGVNNITGALTELDVGSIFQRGGSIEFCEQFTEDKATTTNNLFIIVSSQGELLAYDGDFPGGVWRLIGRHFIGRPVGRRAFIRLENDLWIITDRGLVPVSGLFQTTGSLASETISRKINPLINAQVMSSGTVSGWCGEYLPSERLAVINAPYASDGDAIQYVLNIETGAWTTFQGFAATCLRSHDGAFYFSNGSGKIFRGLNGKSDNGNPIQFIAQNSFQFFGDRGRYKNFIDARPLLRGGDDLTVGVEIDTDFAFNTLTDFPTVTNASTTPWGSSWGSPWATNTGYTFKRLSLRGQGHSGSIKVYGSAQEINLELNATEVRYKKGTQV